LFDRAQARASPLIAAVFAALHACNAAMTLVPDYPNGVAGRTASSPGHGGDTDQTEQIKRRL